MNHAFSILLSLAAFQVTVAGGVAQTEVRPARADSTRITEPGQHAYAEAGRYPYRQRVDYIVAQLDIQPGDTVVDIGAGDGWWSERFARAVGAEGVVHAAEVSARLVAQMERAFADNRIVRPYRCPEDGTGLPDDSCDLAFLAQTYHHLDPDGRVDYLRGLKSVLRLTGRLVVVEKHSGISTRSPDHGTHPEELIEAAEAAGWVLLRFELMPRTYHYLAVFAQRELFPAEPARRGRNGRGRERPAVAERRR